MLDLVALNNHGNKRMLKSVSRSLCRARGCAGLRGGGGEGAVWQRVVGCRWGAPAGEGHARRHGLRRRALHLQTRCVPTAFLLRSDCVLLRTQCGRERYDSVFFRRNFDFFSRFVCFSVMYSCFVVFFAIPCLVFISMSFLHVTCNYFFIFYFILVFSVDLSKLIFLYPLIFFARTLSIFLD